VSRPGITVGVTDHAEERFRQRVPARSSADTKTEIAGRVANAWAAGRVSETPPDGGAARGAVYVSDLLDRDLLFVCRHDARAGELVVITLWERERLGAPRVARRFTDALRERGPRRAGA
jgi:hypothetical protein